ncbi:integration host factor, actinobacterial type [Georgenia sp. Z1344]|uniref:integration host factor, actinobacterial type n=1 Tax=Georgenia sp. Z1344 TaxID=3416706 RepID=UPI003CEDC59D
MTVPPLTADERAAALAKAAEARRVRAEVKSKLKAGALQLSDVLDRAADDEALNKLKVVALLEAMPGVGSSTARAIMAEFNIAESRRVRGLGPHQRSKLVDRFG